MRHDLVILILGVLVAACGSDSGSGVNPTQTFAGTWRATRAQYVAVAAPARQVDVVAQGGTVTLAFSGSNYTFTKMETGKAPQTEAGTFTSSIDVLTLRPSGVAWNTQYDILLSSGTLTLSGGSVQYDFTAGTLEEAKLNLTLIR